MEDIRNGTSSGPTVPHTGRTRERKCHMYLNLSLEHNQRTHFYERYGLLNGAEAKIPRRRRYILCMHNERAREVVVVLAAFCVCDSDSEDMMGVYGNPNCGNKKFEPEHLLEEE